MTRAYKIKTLYFLMIQDFLTIIQKISGLTYECKFGNVTRPASQTSDTSVECIIEKNQEVCHAAVISRKHTIIYSDL